MPSTLSDNIEAYLLGLIRQAEESMLEVSRRNLAERFQCAPSQINYVLTTRFTPERGYVVRSRRGGGGCIVITQVTCNDKSELVHGLYAQAGRGLSASQALDMVRLLRARRVVTEREARLMATALARRTEEVEAGDEARQARGRLTQALLRVLLV